VNSARKQRWQQATALVSLSTAGAMTGIAFAHGTLADMTSPTGMPAHLLAFNKPTKPASTGDGALRSAIVSAAKYYLSLAQGKTPAEMEALIWQDASTDGADHGESCAAFASLTLETGAQATGQQSWVTGGSTYPWPLHEWADVRVDPNPESPGIVSVLQDAEVHQRWHPLGDGYTPQPGDWVMFTGHVEVVTKYSGGVLYTIGGDSMPNLSVNAHQYDDPLGAQGVTGFVNNGELVSSQAPAPAVEASLPSSQSDTAQVTAEQGQAVILGMAPPRGNVIAGPVVPGGGSASHAAPPADGLVVMGTAAIPAAPATSASGSGGPAGHRYSRTQASPSATRGADTVAQQSFIQQVAPGAIEAQRQYGIPAAVTIAQAIDESAWGQSQLAAQDNNLFGIKGTGPAGSVMLPTQEYENGQWVTVSAPFRVYNSVAESIADHSLLLATGSSYKQAMADRQDPDAFANDLTGVYATDPSYGSNLITIMRLYNLYRYGAGTPTGAAAGARASSSSSGSAGLSGVARLGTGVGGGAQGGPAQASSTQASPAQASPAQASSAQASSAQGGAAGDGILSGVVNYGPALGVTGDGAVVDNQAPQSVSGLAARIPGVAGAGSEGGHGGVRHHAERATSVRQDAGAASRTRASGAGESGTSQTSGAASGPRRNATGTSESRRSSARVAASGQAVSGQGGSGQGGSVQGGSGQGGSGQGRAGQGRSGQGRSGQAGSGQSVPRRSSSQPGTAAGGAAAPTVGWPGSGGAGGSGRGSAALGGARIPGLVADSSDAASDQPLRAGPRNARISTRRYVPQIPKTVTMAFVTSAKTPLLRSEPLYRDVARDTGVRWQLLAACDWMQCEAQPRVSPVYGEKLGTKNSDGTVYRSKSSALEQCARDLIDLAGVVYGIDLTERIYLSIRDLASVFAAFRWGGLLATHHISAMEFPYSVEGLTAHHLKMRWPDIPDTPKTDRAGARFPMAFGAVPVVLGLDYPAVA
jgi:flagellum-specific peptidoglycan hydrolase FlgJ